MHSNLSLRFVAECYWLRNFDLVGYSPILGYVLLFLRKRGSVSMAFIELSDYRYCSAVDEFHLLLLGTYCFKMPIALITH